MKSTWFELEVVYLLLETTGISTTTSTVTVLATSLSIDVIAYYPANISYVNLTLSMLIKLRNIFDILHIIW